jgi:N6-adenosine-specific RNA methylase IME4
MAALVHTSGPLLMRLDAARRALAEARTIEDVKDLRDKAAAMLHYVKQRDYSFEAQQDAAEIKIRAERKLGELLAQEGERRGGRSKLHDVISKRGGSKSLPEGIKPVQSHRYQKVASVEPADFERHVAETREQGGELTTIGVMRLAKESERHRVQEKIKRTPDTCTVEDLWRLVEQGSKFGTIYADPPWRYGNQATRAAAAGVYPTMTVEEICALPVAKLAADKCHLHLWTTNAFLFECPKVMEAWGFEYKSLFVWVKPQIGIGNYWRVSHELLLLGVRGGMTFLPGARDLRSWASIDRSEHSEKPTPIRRMIEKASPGPRLELFGRTVADGWSVWGNQIERGLFDKDVRHA